MRDIVRIDRDKCDGCGACAEACSEGAIEMIDGKAVLVREDCCDGLGACLPVCPAGAIAIEKREMPAFQEQIVMAGCPGTRPSEIRSEAGELTNWPVKIRLVPVS
ncbi:MAG: 4Fe-4S binding protein, partial [Candidatus Methanomethylophilaceae archaeon]|nr:4Fe-4S binding protein [Candidatus Methanomethylophilaceae archaeon]